METKNGWLILNIILPLLPLVLRGIIKLLMGEINYETISSAELLFVLALIALIISQDLKIRKVPLDNADKKKERMDKASFFLVLFTVFVFCSAVSEFFHVDVDVKKNDTYHTAYDFMSLFSYYIAVIFVKYSLKVREEFNLTAKFI